MTRSWYPIDDRGVIVYCSYRQGVGIERNQKRGGFADLELIIGIPHLEKEILPLGNTRQGG